MRKSKRMEPVLRIAESREDQAAQAFAESRRQLGEHERQLVQLQGYRREYQTQIDNQAAAGITASRLIDTYRFLAQLDKAITQQQMAVEQATRLCNQKRQHWLMSRQKSQSFEKAKTRFETLERQHEDRREQKVLDELAQRRRTQDE